MSYTDWKKKNEEESDEKGSESKEGNNAGSVGGYTAYKNKGTTANKNQQTAAAQQGKTGSDVQNYLDAYRKAVNDYAAFQNSATGAETRTPESYKSYTDRLAALKKQVSVMQYAAKSLYGEDTAQEVSAYLEKLGKAGDELELNAADQMGYYASTRKGRDWTEFDALSLDELQEKYDTAMDNETQSEDYNAAYKKRAGEYLTAHYGDYADQMTTEEAEKRLGDVEQQIEDMGLRGQVYTGSESGEDSERLDMLETERLELKKRLRRAERQENTDNGMTVDGMTVEEAETRMREINEELKTVQLTEGGEDTDYDAEWQRYEDLSNEYETIYNANYYNIQQSRLENLDAGLRARVEAGGSRREVLRALEETGLSTKEAKDLYNYGKRLREQEREAERTERIEDRAAESRLYRGLRSIESVGESMISGAGTVDTLVQMLVHPMRPVDYNTAVQRITNTDDIIRNAVTENIDSGAGQFAYNIAMSTIDTLAAAAIGKGITKLATSAGATANVANALQSITTNAIFAGSASQSYIREAKEKGATDEQALVGSMLVGAAEAFFEEISLGMLYKGMEKTGKVTVKAAAKHWLIESGVNGSEELATEMADILADWLVMGGISDVESTYNELLDAGYDEQEAKQLTAKAMGARALEAGISGFIQGGLMTGVEIGKQNLNTRSIGKNIAQRGMTEKLGEVAGEDLTGASMLDIGDTFVSAYEKNQGDFVTGDRIMEYLSAEGVTENRAEMGEIVRKALNGEALTQEDYNVIHRTQNGAEAYKAAAKEGTNEDGDKLRAQADSTRKLLQLAKISGNREILAQTARSMIDTETGKTVPGVTENEVTGAVVQATPEYRQAAAQAMQAEAQANAITNRATSNERSIRAAQTGTTNGTENNGETAQKTTAGERMQAEKLERQDKVSYERMTQTAYEFGYSGVAEKDAMQSAALEGLTGAQKMIAYQEGAKARQEESRTKDAEREAGSEKALKKAVKPENARVQASEEAMQVLKRFDGGLNKQANILRAYAAMSGTDIRLVASKVNSDGKYELQDESGADFVGKTTKGQIIIDVNSGLSSVQSAQDLANYTMLRTFGHEVVHDARNWAETEFMDFQKFVFSYMAKKGARVDKLITAYAETYGMTVTDAADEVLAEGLADILPQSRAMAQMAEKHENIFRKIIVKLKEWVSGIREAFAAMPENNEPAKAYLTENVEGSVRYVEEIVQRYDALMVKAWENQQRAKAAEESREKAGNEESGEDAEKQVSEREKARYLQRQAAINQINPFYATHCVQPENLLKGLKDKKGLPGLSIAVQSEGVLTTNYNYGSISLMLAKSTVDINNGTTLWSADAFTPVMRMLDIKTYKNIIDVMAFNAKIFRYIAKKQGINKFTLQLLREANQKNANIKEAIKGKTMWADFDQSLDLYLAAWAQDYYGTRKGDMEKDIGWYRQHLGDMPDRRIPLREHFDYEVKRWLERERVKSAEFGISKTGNTYKLTAENAVKLLKEKNEKLIRYIYNAKDIEVATARKYTDIEEMRKEYSRLTHETRYGNKGVAKAQEGALIDLGYRVLNDMEANGDNTWRANNDRWKKKWVARKVTDLLKDYDGTEEKAKEFFRGKISDETAKKAADVFKMFREGPISYFEAKAMRIVRYDEILTAICPDDITPKLAGLIEKRGIPIIYYRAGDTSDRLHKMLAVDGAKFRRRAMEDTAGKKLTEGQQDYFAGTQARDENGKLEIFYNGSRSDITTFRHDIGGGLFYFTKDKARATAYATGGGGGREARNGKTAVHYEDADGYVYRKDGGSYKAIGRIPEGGQIANMEAVENGYTYTAAEFERALAEGEIMAVPDTYYVKAFYLNVTNPINIREEPETAERVFRYVYDKLQEQKAPVSAQNTVARAINYLTESGGKGLYFWSSTKHEWATKDWEKYIVPELRSLGYDGLIYYDDGAETVAVFDSSQAKTTDNENPTAAEDVRYRRRDAAKTQQETGRNRMRQAEMSDTEVLDKAQAINDVADAAHKWADWEETAMRIYQKRLAAVEAMEETDKELGKTWKTQNFGVKDENGTVTQKPDRIAAAETQKKRIANREALEKARDDLKKAQESKGVQSVLKKSRELMKQRRLEDVDEMARRYMDKRINADKRLKLRDSVIKTSGELMDWLENPDTRNRKYVPDALRGAVSDLVLNIQYPKRAKKNLAEAIRIAKERILETNRAKRELLAVDANLTDNMQAAEDEIRSLYEAYSEKGFPEIDRMTSEELYELDQILRQVKAAVQNANRVQYNQNFETIDEMAEATVKELGEIRYSRAANAVTDYLEWQNMRPTDVFKRFGKGGEAVEEGFRRAQAKYAFNIKEITDFAEETWKAGKVEKWRNTWVTIPVGMTEKRIRLTELMGLYCLVNQQDSWRHIAKYGVDFSSGGETRQVGAMEGVMNEGEKEAVIREMERHPEAKETAEKIQRFMAGKGAKLINEITMQLYGIRAAENPEYYPIESSKKKMAVKAGDQKEETKTDMWSLLNMSFTKNRNKMADNQIMVHDIFDVFSGHMANVAQYNAYALPILDAVRWLNWSGTQETIGEGTQRVDIRTQTPEDKTVISVLTDAFGKAEERGKQSKGVAVRYVQDFIEAANGKTEKTGMMDRFATAVQGRANGAQVAYNLGVALNQPLSIVRAALNIQPKYIVQGATDAANHPEKLKKEMLEHCGIALWKEMGFASNNVTRNVEQMIGGKRRVTERVNDAGMLLAMKMDEMTWTILWGAAKRQAYAQNIRMSDSKYWEKVNHIMEDVIYGSQVVDSLLTRSAIMRSRSAKDKQITAFMGESTASWSSLIRAYDAYKYQRQLGKSKKEAIRESRDKVLRTLAVHIVNMLVNAAYNTIRDTIRDDDDYETIWEKMMEHLPENILDALPVFFLPGASAIKDFVMWGLSEGAGIGEGSSEPTTVSIRIAKPLVKAIQVLNEKREAKAEGKEYYGYNDYGVVYKLLQSASQLSGIGLSSAMRSVMDVWNGIVGEINPEWRIKTYEQSAEKQVKYAYEDGYLTESEAQEALVETGEAEDANEAWVTIRGWGDGGLYGILQDAVEADDESAYAAEKEDLEAHGIGEGKVQSEARGAVKALYKDGDITGEEAEDRLTEYGGMAEEDAENRVRYWAYQSEHPESELSEAGALHWMDTMEPLGVEAEDWEIWWKDLNGITTIYESDGVTAKKTAKEQKEEYVEKLGVSRKVKDAILDILYPNRKK